MVQTFLGIIVLLPDAIVYFYYTTNRKIIITTLGGFCVTNSAFRQGKTDLSNM